MTNGFLSALANLDAINAPPPNFCVWCERGLETTAVTSHQIKLAIDPKTPNAASQNDNITIVKPIERGKADA